MKKIIKWLWEEITWKKERQTIKDIKEGKFDADQRLKDLIAEIKKPGFWKEAGFYLTLIVLAFLMGFFHASQYYAGECNDYIVDNFYEMDYNGDIIGYNLEVCPNIDNVSKSLYYLSKNVGTTELI